MRQPFKTLTAAVIATSLAALVAAAVPAYAQDASGLYDACFVRTYDTEHMKSHPGQRIVEVQAFFQEYEGSLWTAVYYTTLPGGRKFGLSGDCAEAVAGGFLCRVCANDSCDHTGETFKILWPGGASLDLVNDATGVTGVDVAGVRDKLPPGGDDGIFRLERASDPAACDWLPN